MSETTLYRAVTAAELNDVVATGEYHWSEGSIEGKYFFETPDDAVRFARKMKPQLIFTDEREEIVERLQRVFEGCPELKAVRLPPARLRSLEGLDALYLTLPHAERWGAKPILYRAQILKTRGAEEGMPPFVIAGGAFHPDQIRDVRYEVRQVIASVLDAVETFNRENLEKILTVGFWTEISPLVFDRLTPEEAGWIIREMYEDKMRVAA